MTALPGPTPTSLIPGLADDVHNAVKGLAEGSDSEARGAVFTKTEVVDFILDLAGYVPSASLYLMRLLEPSLGGGDFLIPAVRRLFASWRSAQRLEETMIADLQGAIVAVELHSGTFCAASTRLKHYLTTEEGLSEPEATTLAQAWMINSDFLLHQIPGDFDFVIGNPPYVRQELIPSPLLNEYRRLFLTMYDRADLYIPFLEKSLGLLRPNGTLGFICSDRWMKNRYGAPLRQLISSDYHLRFYVDMVDTAAFNSEVVAYPAITIVSRQAGSETRVLRQPKVDSGSLKIAARQLQEPAANSPVEAFNDVACGQRPWILGGAPEKLSLVRKLESNFPPIERSGCKVGIGVATGADRVFIDDYDSLDIEECRKLRLATTKDIETGVVRWLGKGIANPFDADGKLVALDAYPKMQAFFEANADRLKSRHCARKSPKTWYRTIDRIYPPLAETPKLLIPDIKGRANVVLEKGSLYPHHNLYYITSTEWDLDALAGVLRAGIAHLFVETYSTRMRGGYFRFQAQYLRRIRLPAWDSLAPELRDELVAASRTNDATGVLDAVKQLYGLSTKEMALLASV